MSDIIEAPAGALPVHVLSTMRHLLREAVLRIDPLAATDPDGPSAGWPAAAGVTASAPRPRRHRSPIQAAIDMALPGTPVAADLSSDAIAAAIAADDDVYAAASYRRHERPRPRPDLRQLLTFARLAQALPGPDDADALMARGAVTLLAVPGEDTRRAVTADLGELGLLLAGRPCHGGSRDGVLNVRQVEISAMVGREATESARAAVEAEIAAGCTLLLVAAGRADLPESARLLVKRVLALPDAGADAVIEILRVTHSDTGALAEAAIRAILPPDADLARLPVTLWLRAWTERTTLLVARRLADACARLPRPSGITLADVHGQPEAVAALGDMVRDLRDWRAGRVDWRDVSSSALLAGPPGTCKTMLAAALAGSAGAHLVATSYADCQRAGHLGDYLRAMSERVEEAIARAPSVSFLDELDSFSTRSVGERGDRYMASVVNALLQQLTRLNDAPGVLIVAATNYPERVDPAIVRAGRFDHHIMVGLPDRTGIAAILHAHLGDRLGPVDPGLASDRLTGCSGAVVAAVARAALGSSRRAGRGLAAADLDAAADRHGATHAPDLLHAIAAHEAGHVVATAALGLPAPTRVRITPTGGETCAALPERLTRADLDARLTVLMAGRVAEILVIGEASSGAGYGPGSDLDCATTIALAIETEHGLAGDLIHAPVPRADRHRMPAALCRRVEMHLRTAEGRAWQVLRDRRTMLEAVAEALLGERELNAQRIAGLTIGAGEGSDARGPAMPDQNPDPDRAAVLPDMACAAER